MARMRIGRKPGVGSVLKIMKNNTDDPWTTPSADWQKFIFDSERAHKLGYVKNISAFVTSFSLYPAPGSNGQTNRHNLPSGSSYANAKQTVWTYKGSSYNVISTSIWMDNTGFSYTPLIEMRWPRNGRFYALEASFNTTDSSGSSKTGYMQGGLSYKSEYRNYGVLFDSSTVSRRMWSLLGFYGVTRHTITYLRSVDYWAATFTISTLELPADSSPMPNYASEPQPGQKMLKISPQIVRMAYPGHDINETNDEAFIFNESRIPAKIIGAGEVQVNSGANVKVFTKRPTTPTTYMDFMVRRTGDAMCHPPFLPTGTSDTYKVNMEYTIEADGVRIYNTGDPHIVVRYMILADDDSPPTTGGRKVLVKGNDGTQDFIQLKRPGSSDTSPNISDIMLDTRLPYVPIVDEGWLARGDFNEGSDSAILGYYKKTINFENDGTWMPFVKYMASWADGSISAPVNRIIRSWNIDQNPVYNNVQSGASTNCRVSKNKLEFYHTSGSPWHCTIKSGAFGTYCEPVYGPALTGIRWYLFAIPNSF